ncbi:MAG TPA: MBL fold metallo-hydrolase [Gaiella sp.]
MRELQEGLWWWEAVHPEWTPEDAAAEDWGPEVSSYAIDDGSRLLLVFAAGDRLPVGVEAFPGMEPNDLVLWVESRRALVAGDTLIDRGSGLEFPAD